MSKWTGEPEPLGEGYLHCGFARAGEDLCRNPARYQGAFLVGAWQALVPLCEDHVRGFMFLIATDDMRGKAAAAMTLTMEVHLAPKVFELGTGEEYKLPRQVYTCSECGRKIVRSFETGAWLIVPDPHPSGVPGFEVAIAPHEHMPG